MIHQFNLQFNPEEDRITFRLNTVNKEEFRFFLTRRYIKLLWPVLMQLLNADLEKRAPEKSHAAKEILEFEHEKVISKSNFKKSFSNDVMSYPLGENPILLSRIRVKQAKGVNILCLHPSKGGGVEFPVNNNFLHPFCKLIKETTLRAEWSLEALFNQLPQQINPGQGKRTLH